MDISIYVHLPFCERKCAYCDFLSGVYGEDEIRKYIGALKDEIRFSDAREGRVCSVFFGGGTPSCIDPGYIEEILGCLKESYEFCTDAEITVEVNPHSSCSAKLQRYRDAGINRVSIGVQSFNDDELRLLSRLHDSATAEDTVRQALSTGFTDVSLDLITHLPGQSIEKLSHTLETAVGLGPSHISAYNLIVEKGTPFYERYAEGAPLSGELPDEDLSLRLDKLVRRSLSRAGYERYEVSNFARPGHQCIHNLGYWRRRPYRGYGLGAASLIKTADAELRFTAEQDMADYLRDSRLALSDRISAAEPLRALSLRERMEEFMFLGLRCMSGIDEREFTAVFERDIIEVFGDMIAKAQEYGFMVCEDGIYRFTETGMDVSNVLLAGILED